MNSTWSRRRAKSSSSSDPTGSAITSAERGGYLTVVGANALYVPIAVAHFVQHMNRQEVDWAHAGLGITNAVAALGVLYVTYISLRRVG